MNRIGIAIAMFLIAVLTCGFEIFTVNKSTSIYSDELQQVSRLMSEEDFESASRLSASMLDSWKTTAKKLDKYLYHDYIDHITEGMSVLPVYAENKDKLALNAQIEEIKIQLTSLKESELPYLHNIL